MRALALLTQYQVSVEVTRSVRLISLSLPFSLVRPTIKDGGSSWAWRPNSREWREYRKGFLFCFLLLHLFFAAPKSVDLQVSKKKTSAPALMSRFGTIQLLLFSCSWRTHSRLAKWRKFYLLMSEFTKTKWNGEYWKKNRHRLRIWWKKNKKNQSSSGWQRKIEH